MNKVRMLAAVLALGACLTSGAAVAQAPRASTPQAYAAHLTSIAAGANTSCGPIKAFVVSIRLQRGHRFAHLNAFYLRLRGGPTVRIPYESFNLSTDRRTVTYYAHDVPLDSEVSPYLRKSHTTFTATPGSRWTATVKSWCYTM